MKAKCILFRRNYRCRLIGAVAFAISLLGAAGPRVVHAASLDCKRGHTFVEKAICGNPRLFALDKDVARAYETAAPVVLRPDLLQEDQRRWLRDIRDVCGDVACLRRVHEGRVAELSELTTREEEAARRDPTRGQDKVCAIPGFTTPPDFAVLAAGGFAGKPLDFQIDQSGHPATQVDVTVHRPDKPVVLMLGAYEPTIWSVRHSADTRIAAVVVSGYHRQVVTGVDGIPALNSSHDNQGPCGYFYPKGDGLQALNPIARRLVGKPAEIVYPIENGRVAVGGPPPSDVEFVGFGLRPAQAFRDEDAPIAGQPGLDEAVRKGQLRAATAGDRDAWASVAPASTKLDIPPEAGKAALKPALPILLNAYVVLQRFRYPAGLYGRNAATFLIPKGVAQPTGNLGHSTAWDFNTGRCSGVLCAGGSAVVIDIDTSSEGEVQMRRLR